MPYTPAEKEQLMDGWIDRVAEADPEFAESLIKSIIEKQEELGLIGPQRKKPVRSQGRVEGDQDGN